MNDRVIANCLPETIARDDGEFISVSYPIPRDITVGMFNATVKFRAKDEYAVVGPVYGVRIIKGE
ncbi:MAG: hypothetical protein U5K32_09450 [Bacteroidales bacterium]|nr:hypothetical protein [Bacteroidales bacterium]